MPIVPILIGLAFLGGIVALFMSAPTWRWYHITMVSLIMLVSLAWFYLAARTLKIQDAWRTEVNKYEKAYLTAEKDQEKIIQEGLSDDGKTHLPLDRLKTEVDKILQGRGRVWGLRVAVAEGEPPSPPPVQRRTTGADGKITALVEKPAPHGIERGMILWAFDDADTTAGGQLLGEFEVTAVNGPEIQMSPVLKLRPSELQRIAQRRSGPLVLYEVMPTDTHDLLRHLSDLLSPPEGEPKLDDAVMLDRLFRNTVPDDVKKEYVQDGKPPAAGETQADRVWRRVRAPKEFTVELSPAEAKAMQDAGQTVELAEGTGKPILRIAEGTVLDLDPKTAAEQIAKENVEPLVEEGQTSNQVYIRQLRDYARLYRDLNLQIESLLATTAEVDRQNAAIQEATRKVNQDIAYRESEKAALTSDLARYNSDLQILRNLVTGLETQIANLSRELRETADENGRLENQLAMLTRQALSAINRQTAAAAPGR